MTLDRFLTDTKHVVKNIKSTCFSANYGATAVKHTKEAIDMLYGTVSAANHYKNSENSRPEIATDLVILGRFPQTIAPMTTAPWNLHA
jgi:hypothetical protein